MPGARSPAAPRRPPDPACAPSFIVADFRRRGVDVTHVAWQPRGDVPCACCVVSAASGSRTIVLHDTWVPSPPRDPRPRRDRRSSRSAAGRPAGGPR